VKFVRHSKNFLVVLFLLLLPIFSTNATSLQFTTHSVPLDNRVLTGKFRNPAYLEVLTDNGLLLNRENLESLYDSGWSKLVLQAFLDKEAGLRHYDYSRNIKNLPRYYDSIPKFYLHSIESINYFADHFYIDDKGAIFYKNSKGVISPVILNSKTNSLIFFEGLALFLKENFNIEIYSPENFLKSLEGNPLSLDLITLYTQGRSQKLLQGLGMLASKGECSSDFLHKQDQSNSLLEEKPNLETLRNILQNTNPELFPYAIYQPDPSNLVKSSKRYEDVLKLYKKGNSKYYLGLANIKLGSDYINKLYDMHTGQAPLSFNSPSDYRSFIDDLKSEFAKDHLDEGHIQVIGTGTTYFSLNPHKGNGIEEFANKNRVRQNIFTSDVKYMDKSDISDIDVHLYIPKLSKYCEELMQQGLVRKFNTRTRDVFLENNCMTRRMKMLKHKYEAQTGREVNFSVHYLRGKDDFSGRVPVNMNYVHALDKSSTTNIKIDATVSDVETLLVKNQLYGNYEGTKSSFFGLTKSSFQDILDKGKETPIFKVKQNSIFFKKVTLGYPVGHYYNPLTEKLEVTHSVIIKTDSQGKLLDFIPGLP
jgi:hypothetical protein